MFSLFSLILVSEVFDVVDRYIIVYKNLPVSYAVDKLNEDTEA